MIGEESAPTVVSNIKSQGVTPDLTSHRCGVCGFIVEVQDGKVVHSSNAQSAIAKQYVKPHAPVDGGIPKRDSHRGAIG